MTNTSDIDTRTPVEPPPGSPSSKVHELKCWPESFNAILLGLKTAEVRINDRGFAAGDELVLKEYLPADSGRYTGSELHVTIRHVHKLDEYIDTQGYVLLSLFPVGSASCRAKLDGRNLDREGQLGHE